MRMLAVVRIGAICCILTAPPAAPSAFAAAQDAASASYSCTGSEGACTFFRSYIAAFNSRDFAAFTSTFAEDISVFFDRPLSPERRDGSRSCLSARLRVLPSRRWPPRTFASTATSSDRGACAGIWGLCNRNLLGRPPRRPGAPHGGATPWEARGMASSPHPRVVGRTPGEASAVSG